jgi:hypothetical protein
LCRRCTSIWTTVYLTIDSLDCAEEAGKEGEEGETFPWCPCLQRSIPIPGQLRELQELTQGQENSKGQEDKSRNLQRRKEEEMVVMEVEAVVGETRKIYFPCQKVVRAEARRVLGGPFGGIDSQRRENSVCSDEAKQRIACRYRSLWLKVGQLKAQEGHRQMQGKVLLTRASSFGEDSTFHFDHSFHAAAYVSV